MRAIGSGGAMLKRISGANKTLDLLSKKVQKCEFDGGNFRID